MSKRSRAREEARRQQARRRRLGLIGGLAAVAVMAVALIVWALSAPSKGTSDALLTAVEQIQRIDPLEAKSRIDAGQALLYDVRSRATYDTRHAAGAIALPEDELETLIGGLPHDKDLIFY